MFYYVFMVISYRQVSNNVVIIIKDTTMTDSKQTMNADSNSNSNSNFNVDVD